MNFCGPSTVHCCAVAESSTDVNRSLVVLKMKESSLKEESRELTRSLDERVEYLSRYDATTLHVHVQLLLPSKLNLTIPSLNTSKYMYMDAANCRKVREFGHRLKKLVHFQLEIQQKQLLPLVSEREDVLQQRQQVHLLRFQSFTLKSDSKEKLWSGFRDGRDSADDPCAVLARSVSRNESKD